MNDIKRAVKRAALNYLRRPSKSAGGWKPVNDLFISVMEELEDDGLAELTDEPRGDGRLDRFARIREDKTCR